MTWVLGIDGGATRSIGLLGDATGVPLARAEAGPANVQVVGTSGLERALRSLAGMLTGGIGGIEHVDAAALGLAGVARPSDFERVLPLLVALGFPKRTLLVHDARIALLGGAGDDHGVLLCAGTGSICYGRTKTGVEARAGGWGHLLGDEGSGYALGLAALRAVLRALDGRDAPTALTDLVLGTLRLAQPYDLVDWVRRASKPHVAALSRTVFVAAQQNDSAAITIIHEGADALATLALTVLRKLRWTSPPTLVLSGGVFLHEAAYRTCVADRIVSQYEQVNVQTPGAEPAYGALLLARQRLERDDSNV